MPSVVLVDNRHLLVEGECFRKKKGYAGKPLFPLFYHLAATAPLEDMVFGCLNGLYRQAAIKHTRVVVVGLEKQSIPFNNF